METIGGQICGIDQSGFVPKLLFIIFKLNINTKLAKINSYF